MSVSTEVEMVTAVVTDELYPHYGLITDPNDRHFDQSPKITMNPLEVARYRRLVGQLNQMRDMISERLDASR